MSSPPKSPIASEKKRLHTWKQACIIHKHLTTSLTRTHGSIKNSLWHLPTRVTLNSFVRAIVSEFRFERHSSVKDHLTTFFESFGSDKVDTRLVLCIFRFFTLGDAAFAHPDAVVYKLWDVFVDPTTNEVRHNLICLGAVTPDEFEATKGDLSRDKRVTVPPSTHPRRLSRYRVGLL